MKVDFSKVSQRVIDALCSITPCAARCGGENSSWPDHPCPYAEEINDDYEFLCNCCGECISECSDDI